MRSARLAGRDAGGDRPRPRLGHRRPRLGRGEVGGQHHQRGRLERAAAPERVERILQVVASGEDDDAGVEQRAHGGEPTGYRLRMAAPLEVEVRRRQRDDGDAGGGDGLGGLPLACGRLHSEADAVARRDRQLEPGRRHVGGEVGEPVDVLVERLVGVQVDAARRGRRRWRGTCRSRRACRPPRGAGSRRRGRRRHRGRRGAAPAGRRRPVPVIGHAAEGDDLHVDDVGDATADFRQRLDAAQSVLQCRVGVRAHGAEAVARPSAGRPARRARSCRRRRAAPRPAIIASIAPSRSPVGLAHALGEERLVEVGVRLDGGGQQDVTGEVELVVIRHVARRRRRRRSRPSLSRTSPVVPSASVARRSTSSAIAGLPTGTLGPCDHR